MIGRLLPVLVLALAYAPDQPLREPTLLSEAFNSVPGVLPSFTHDGKTAYYGIQRPPHGRLPAHNVLVVSRFVAGQWTPPAWLEFSGQNQEGDIRVSPDGSRLFFWSYRSGAEVESPLKQDSDIWFVERDGAGWGLPKRLEAPINSEVRDYMGSFAADGTLYLTSLREGGRGQADLYLARPQGNGFAAPENLGEAVNSPHSEYSPAVSPDGQTLVFASDRPGVLGRWDLHVSFRKDGVWQPARNLGRPINSVFHEASPLFSPDGKYLFFNSDRSGKPQVYQIDADVLRVSVAAEPHPYASPEPIPEPAPFAKGVISTPGSGCITFAADGKSAIFARPRPDPSRLMATRFEGGRWTTPEVAPFSGRYFDGDPVFAPDGRRLFFASGRPVNGQQPQRGAIWYVEKTADGWSEPKQPRGPGSWSGSFASAGTDGTLYFFSGGPDTRGATDIFRAPFRGGQYAGRENLGEMVNGRGNDVDPYVAPDQSFLIFASDRAGGMGRTDLYISLNKEGRWGAPRNLGPLVNSTASEVCPCVSPDGRYFFFTSDRNDGQPQIHQIDIGVLRLGE